MRFLLPRSLTIALLFCAVAPAAAYAADGDRLSSLLGTWTCSSAQNNASSKSITRNADGSLAIVNVVSGTNGIDAGTISETYRLDSATGQWALTATPSRGFPFGVYTASAKAWTERQWIFEGHEPLMQSNGVSRDTVVRLVYTDLFPAGFRREHQVKDNGAWREISEEVCLR